MLCYFIGYSGVGTLLSFYNQIALNIEAWVFRIGTLYVILLTMFFFNFSSYIKSLSERHEYISLNVSVFESTRFSQFVNK